jgi:hypothetical protein
MENSKPKLRNRRVYDLDKHEKTPVSENPNLIRATDGQVARNVPRLKLRSSSASSGTDRPRRVGVTSRWLLSGAVNLRNKAFIASSVCYFSSRGLGTLPGNPQSLVPIATPLFTLKQQVNSTTPCV